MTASSRIDPLPWESDFFAKKLGIVEVGATGEGLVLSEFAGFDLVEAKVPASHLATLDALFSRGFKFVETEVTYVYQVDHRAEDIDFRVADSMDLCAVRGLARRAFRFSRFRPPWFTENDSARFYGAWAENAIRGTFDDQCLIIEESGQLLGFVTARENVDSSGRIGLLASSEDCRGKGVGERLVRASISWCASRGIEHLSVATQLSNTNAMRLYERTGALVDKTAYWLYWSSNAA